MTNILLLLFVAFPLSYLIDLFGHLLFVKIFRGKIKNIIIGTGKTILRIHKVEIKSLFFSSIEYSYVDLKINNKVSRILINLGGFLFTSATAVFLYCMISLGLVPAVSYNRTFLIVLALNSIASILPITIAGVDTDGKQILQLLKTPRFGSLLKDDKNQEMRIEQLSDEVVRLKHQSMKSGSRFMRSKYIAEVFNKSCCLDEAGYIKEGRNTLKEIYHEVSNETDRFQIKYYNNLLDYTITLDEAGEVDELYTKLMELLSKEENKIYESDAVKDTIQMYKSYKSSHSNFEAAEETKESDLCNDAEGEKYITYDELMKRKAKIKRSYTKADMFGDLRILLGVLIICAVLFGTRRHIYKLLILIQEKSLQLFWLGAAVMVIAIITGTYYLARILLRKRVFSFHYFDNSNGFSIVDLGIKSFIPVDEYDTLFNIKIQLSSSHTGKDLMKITNLLFNLAFRKKFILAGAIYDNSALKYEILVYSNYEYSTRKALLKLLDKKVSFPYTIEKTKDSKWNIYNEYLHPDEYTLIKTVNAGWVEHLEARGHDFLKEHPVAFYLAFKNYEDSVKCVAAAEKSGFEKALYLNDIEDLKDSGTLKKDYHMVGLQLTSKIGLERLNFISKQAIDFASEYNGKVEDIKLEELDSIIQ